MSAYVRTVWLATSQVSIPLCVQGLLTRVRDNNKHVQEAACSALATLEEAAGRELLESSRITAILKTFAAALQVLLFASLLATSLRHFPASVPYCPVECLRLTTRGPTTGDGSVREYADCTGASWSSTP